MDVADDRHGERLTSIATLLCLFEKEFCYFIVTCDLVRRSLAFGKNLKAQSLSDIWSHLNLCERIIESSFRQFA